MSFSTREEFEKSRRTVSSLDPDDKTPKPSLNNSSSPKPGLEPISKKYEKLRPIPSLSYARLGINKQSNFFKLSADALVYESAFFNIQEHSVMARSCRAGRDMFKQPVIAARLQQLLDAAVRGEKDRVEKIITVNPKLMMLRGNTIDYSDRHHVGRTVLQIALGAVDKRLREDDDEAMVEMIERHFRSQDNGEEEIAKQYHEQFPEGHYTIEQQKIALDSVALNRVINVVKLASNVASQYAQDLDAKIQNILQGKEDAAHSIPKLQEIINNIHKANSNEHFEKNFADLMNYLKENKVITDESPDSSVLKAIYQFRNYLEPKGDYTTGKHFNLELLAEAATAYDANYESFGHWGCPKNLVCFQKVFGLIERFVPACDAQVIAQGLYYVFEKGEKSKRSLAFLYDMRSYLPLDSDPSFRLGYNLGGDVGGNCVQCGTGRAGGGVYFSKLCLAKASGFGVKYPQSTTHSVKKKRG